LGYAFTSTIGVSLLAGAFGWASIGLLRSSLRGWRERAAITGGVAGVRPSDGRRAVLVGTIEPLQVTLRAPMDGSECVAYSYEVTEDRGSGRQRTVLRHFKGYGLAPSVIITRTGSYQRYAREAVFSGPSTSAQELLDRWGDVDGSYRSDVAYAPIDQIDLTKCVLTQQHLRRGAPVCVFGTFSDAKGGIVASPTEPTRVIGGNAEQVAAVLRSTATTRLVLSMLGAAAAVGLVAAFVSG
jgi:hypothetical protein